MTSPGMLAGEKFARRELRLISPTVVMEWEQCPRRVWHLYVRRARPPVSPHLAYSNAVHYALAEFYRRPTDQRKLANLLMPFVQEFKQQTIDLTDDHPQELADYRRRGVDLLLGWWNAAGDDRYAIPQVEVELEWLADQFKIRGRADRIDAAPEGVTILDWKTGNPSDASIHQGLQQLRMYAVMYRRTYGEPVAQLGLLYLEPLNRIQVPCTNRELDAGEKYLTQVAAEMHQAYDQRPQADAFPARPGKQCEWCFFAYKCREGTRHLAAKQLQSGAGCPPILWPARSALERSKSE